MPIKLTDEVLFQILEQHGDDDFYVHNFGRISATELAGEIVALRAQLALDDAALDAARDVVGAACQAFDPEQPEAMPEDLNRAIFRFVMAAAEARDARTKEVER